MVLSRLDRERRRVSTDLAGVGEALCKAKAAAVVYGDGDKHIFDLALAVLDEAQAALKQAEQERDMYGESLTKAADSTWVAKARVSSLERALREIALGEPVERDGVIYVKPGQEFARAALGDA